VNAFSHRYVGIHTHTHTHAHAHTHAHTHAEDPKIKSSNITYSIKDFITEKYNKNTAVM
jgi:hypothetical protein